MSEQVHNSQEIQEFINERRGWLNEAVVAVGGEDGANPRELFLAPTEVRDDAQPLELSDEQEAKLREVAGRFGIGGEADVFSGAAVDVVEGGKPWKIEAEARLASGIKVYSGTAERVIGDDEAAYLQEKLQPGQEMPQTEYDVARLLASSEAGFVPLENERVIAFGYSVSEQGIALSNEATGQIVQIGETAGQPVFVARVDREYYVNEDGKRKYRQPGGTDLLQITANAMGADGREVGSVGLLTSNTYASRALDVTLAGVKDGRDYRVGMYGRQTLADVKAEPVASPAPVNQIPGELYVIAGKLDKLQQAIASQEQ